jgi:hypothetical protein
VPNENDETSHCLFKVIKGNPLFGKVVYYKNVDDYVGKNHYNLRFGFFNTTNKPNILFLFFKWQLIVSTMLSLPPIVTHDDTIFSEKDELGRMMKSLRNLLDFGEGSNGVGWE